MLRSFMAAAALFAGLFAFPPFCLSQPNESHYNRVLRRPPYPASAPAVELHKQLLIVDLHADSLLWSRDLLRQSQQGHVDVPRLIKGNVAIQMFTVVTKSPRDQNISRNSDETDTIVNLAKVDKWPQRTWHSLKQRALYQAERLRNTADTSGGTLTLIRTRSDLDSLLQRRTRDARLTGAILGLEGAHALEGNLENLEELYQAGFRMVALTHFFDTDLAGSASGIRKDGLTTKGRELVRRMQSKHMLIDLAHASPKTIQDVTAMATAPVIVSHTGVRGACDNQRNLADREIRAIAKTGGVVGIGYWPTAVCGSRASDIARSIRHAVKIAGIEHVALGSDFDGAVMTPFDTTGVVQVTDALLKEGFSKGEIERIMGGNALRVLRQTLP